MISRSHQDWNSSAARAGRRKIRAASGWHLQQRISSAPTRVTLALDEEQAVADYMTAAGATQPQPPQPEGTFPVAVTHERKAPPSPDRRIRNTGESSRRDAAADIPWGILAIALLVVAILLASWSYLHRPPESEKTRVAPVPNPRQRLRPLPPTPAPILPPRRRKASPRRRVRIPRRKIPTLLRRTTLQLPRHPFRPPSRCSHADLLSRRPDCRARFQAKRLRPLPECSPFG